MTIFALATCQNMRRTAVQTGRRSIGFYCLRLRTLVLVGLLSLWVTRGSKGKQSQDIPLSTASSVSLDTPVGEHTRFLNAAISRCDIPPLPPTDKPQDVNDWVRCIASHSRRISVESLGHSRGGREILCVTAGAGYMGKSRVPTIAVICRQHGNEPASTVAALNLIADIAATTMMVKCAVMERVRFIIIPMVNPDGAAANRRFANNHINPNRDWGIFRLPETTLIGKLIDKAQPDVLLDCHELLPHDYTTVPYVECTYTGEHFAGYVRQVVAAHGNKLSIGFPAADCPGSLLYRYFTRRYHRPGVMVESSIAARRNIGIRSRIHFAAAWAAAAYVHRHAYGASNERDAILTRFGNETLVHLPWDPAATVIDDELALRQCADLQIQAGLHPLNAQVQLLAAIADISVSRFTDADLILERLCKHSEKFRQESLQLLALTHTYSLHEMRFEQPIAVQLLKVGSEGNRGYAWKSVSNLVPTASNP